MWKMKKATESRMEEILKRNVVQCKNRSIKKLDNFNIALKRNKRNFSRLLVKSSEFLVIHHTTRKNCLLRDSNSKAWLLLSLEIVPLMPIP